jgi:hypothetical protein
LLIFSCATAQENFAAPQNLIAQDSKAPQGKRELLRSEPAQKPEWVNTVPQSGGELYFIGTSRAYGTVTDARNAAREDAFNQIVKYYGQYIKSTGIERTTLSGTSTDILNPYIEKEEEISRFAENIISQVSADKYYTEIYMTARNKEEIIVYVLCQIARSRAERDIENFAKNISERYGNLIGVQTTLSSALKVYSDIYEALNENPLHRAVAYYNSANGKTGLSEYCAMQINALAGSVSFAPVPFSTVQKGEALNTTVKLSSTMMNTIGASRCRVNIAGGNNRAPSPNYTVDNNNNFSLSIYTDKLEAGKYTVTLELLLNEIAPNIKRNPSNSFSFEITPLNTIRIALLNDDANSIAPKIRDIMQKQGLLLVESGGAYIATVELSLNERQSNNYFYIEPSITIVVELERDGTPLVTYTKKYGEFRHVTRAEALQRAYRNIENDLGGNFAEQVRGIGQ